MEIITSLENKKIKRYSKLSKRKYREKEGMFIAEGHHLVEEALKHGEVIEVFTTSEKLKGTLITERIMKFLSQTENPQNILAICKIPSYQEEVWNRVVALDYVQDPGNVGTIIRTAKAFNYDAVIVAGCDAFNPKSIRATQGAIFQIPVINVKDISCKFNNYEIVGAVLEKDAIIYNEYKPKKPFILVLGSEGNGISEKNKNLLNKKVYIPIKFESINVASAGAILLNEYKEE